MEKPLRTPKGTLLADPPEGCLPPGTLVVVQGATGLDEMCEGREGTLLGYSVPFAYAVIAWQGREILVRREFVFLRGEP